MDEEKVKGIQDWFAPKSVSEVRSFYKRFVKYFSTIGAPLNEVVKKSVGFKLGRNKNWLLFFLKRNYVLHLFWLYLTLRKHFEIQCDASRMGIGALLMQDQRRIAYFSEKLSGATLNYPTYEKELMRW